MAPIFSEVQHLGHNRYGILRRSVVMLFCFVFYYVSSSESKTAEIFFYLGIAMLVLNMLALSVAHLRTEISGTKISLRGALSFRKAEFDLEGLRSAESKPFSRFLLNRPIFNLHRRGAHHFFTHGHWCVKFETRHGEVVKLGTQRPAELLKVLQGFLAKTE